MDEEKNLLAQLHKLASRQDENFLTEAFAHLLRHLRDHEPQVAVDILCRLTGGQLKIGAEGIREKLTITTQVTTEQGRPDIEIAIKGQFRAFVEAKSQSSVRKGQLKQYRKELNNSGLPTRALALVLLTRYPAEIPDDDEKPDVFCRWYQIAGWLEAEYNKEGRIKNAESGFLTNQFVEFLKIRNIAMEKAGPELAAGLKSLTNILKMLEEAINANADRAKGYYKCVAEFEYIGFALDDKKFLLFINYEDPTILGFQTNGHKFSVTNDAEQRAGFGKWEKNEDWGEIWSHELKLDSAFFGRSKDDQMKCLFDFVRKCLAATKKIKGR